jgi:TolB-like protein/DNA-binding winged helix-turn-helix (wHTH) protein/tetratricopeptide (TPR) repeat protein
MPGKVFQFADFKLDCGRFELYRSGLSLKLEKKPMELLILLAESNGQLVSRAQIAQRLWEREVFVDTEHGINTAIRKIRQVLRDDPERPRFVETVTGKGYRFVSLVEVRSAGTEAAEDKSPPTAVPRETVPILDQSPNATAPVGEGKASHPPVPLWLATSGGLAAVVILISVILLAGRGLAKLRARNAQPQVRSVAVLPLDNLSGDPGQNYFADGITDELTTMLAKNSTLRIVSRTSVMQYKGVHRPLPEIARELGVDGVLEGSVARSGDRVHMTIQLIQAPSDTHIWAESYDRDANEVVSLPREAAETIAKQLKSTVPQSPPASRFVSPEAHDAYLRGRYLWFAGPNEKAGSYFKRATELQPDYAQGWAGLANYYGGGAVIGDLNPEESLPAEEVAANKAVTLDDSLAEGHLAMSGAFFLGHWDWTRAEAELKRAIELDPNLAEAYHFHAKILAALNRHQEAIAAQKKASELDPFERPWAMTMSLREARLYDAAISDIQHQMEADSKIPSGHWFLYDSYRRKGAEKKAALELEKANLYSGDQASAAAIRHAIERGGYSEVVRWQLDDAIRKSSTEYLSPVYLATLNAQLGRREETLALLEQGYREHSPLLLWIQNDPAFDFLHSNERYRSIIKRIGLPAVY